MSYKNHSLMYDRRDLPNSHYEKFTLTGEIKCIDDEIPFDLPKDWEWCRIKDISRSYIGLTYKPEDISSTGTIVLRSSNIREGKIVLEDVVKVSKSMPDNLLVEPNDIIICARNGSKKLVGKSALVTEISETTTFGAFMAICKTPLYQYVYCFLQSELFFSQLSDVSGTTTINQLTQNNFNQFLVPIPPLVEQERIIAKIEELMPLVERYGKAQGELEALNNNIREQLKKSVLQYAIEGKLVPQYEEDGTAEDLLQEIQAEKQRLYAEGKLKKKDLAHSSIFRGEDNKYFEKKDKDIVCIDEEIPFDLPDTWVWVRLEDICEYIQRGKSPKYSPIKKYPVIAQKCNQWRGFSIEKAQFIVPETISNYGEERKLQDRDLLWNSTGLGTLGRIAIYYSKLNPYELAVADSHVTVIRALKKHVSPEYLYAYFSSYTVQSVIEYKSDGSTKQKELATNTVKAYLVPLPPYKEQKCIVNRIDKVFAYLT